MKRIIIDHKKLTPSLASLLLEAYPQGYGDEDLIAFKNAQGEWIEAVELQTGDALYLVKINKSLSNLLASMDLEEATSENEETRINPLANEYDGSLESEMNLGD